MPNMADTSTTAQKVAAEVLGTFGLVFFGCGSVTFASPWLASLFGQFAEAFQRGGSPQPGTSGQGAGASPGWEEMVRAMMAGGMPGAGSLAGDQGGASPANPFAEMMGTMFGGNRGPAGAPGAQAAAGGTGPGTPFDVWGQIFQTGREVQDQHMMALRNIFDTFWGAPREGAGAKAKPS